MPKLIIKHELPPPSIEDRVIGILQIILPIIVIVIGIAAAVSLYFPASDSPVAATPVEMKPTAMDTVAAEQVEKSVTNTVAAETSTNVPAAEAKLPPGVCPLFGPGAQECKAGKH